VSGRKTTNVLLFLVESNQCTAAYDRKQPKCPVVPERK